VSSVHEAASGLAALDAAPHSIKPGNSSRIEWLTPLAPSRTDVAVLYLHGLTASPMECSTHPAQLAFELGANLLSLRLPGHGSDEPDAAKRLTREAVLDRVMAGLDIAGQIGERVVLLGSSFGASLCLVVAARHPACVAALALWSPGIRARSRHELARLAALDSVVELSGEDAPGYQRAYWSRRIHSDAYAVLWDMFEQDMTTEQFERVHAPTFVACFYREEEHQDPLASVQAMRAMHEQLGTPRHRKELRCYPHGAHVIGSPFKSCAATDVLDDTIHFLRVVLDA
jgi:pimeloyl-ACP methyl ester carboxylesterase